MAEYCNACAKELFNDSGDFTGLTDEESWNSSRAVCVICDGCGLIQVDPEGNCASYDCKKAGEKGHGVKWKRYTI